LNCFHLWYCEQYCELSCECLCIDIYFQYSQDIPRCELIGSHRNSFRNHQVFSKASVLLCILTHNVWSFQASHIFSNTHYYLSLVKIIFMLVSVTWYGFRLNTPHGYWCWSTFHIFVIYISSLEKYLSGYYI
jgi:hypothetical protein